MANLKSSMAFMLSGKLCENQMMCWWIAIYIYLDILPITARIYSAVSVYTTECRWSSETKGVYSQLLFSHLFRSIRFIMSWVFLH